MPKSKEPNLIFSHFKLLFFIIAAVIVLILIYLGYSYINSANWHIQLSYYNASVVGDGTSTVVIPFSIITNSGEPLTNPVQVQAIADIGSVTIPKCGAPSVCNVTFQAPKTAKTEYAQVSINAGGVIKTLQIEINPSGLIYTVGGATAEDYPYAGQQIAMPVVAPASGTLKSIGIDLQSASGNIQMAIYADCSGQPCILLGSSPSYSAKLGWNDVSFTGITINPGTRYWIAVESDTTSNYYYYSSSAPIAAYQSQTYGTWSNPFNPKGYAYEAINMRMSYEPQN